MLLLEGKAMDNRQEIVQQQAIKRFACHVASFSSFANHVYKIVLTPPRDCVFDFLPGQYLNVVLESDDLVVPHPGVYDRVFVLFPLFQLKPDLVFPNGNSLDFYVKKCDISCLSLVE